jgi:hypothetical protein
MYHDAKTHFASYGVKVAQQLVADAGFANLPGPIAVLGARLGRAGLG